MFYIESNGYAATSWLATSAENQGNGAAFVRS